MRAAPFLSTPMIYISSGDEWHQPITYSSIPLGLTKFQSSRRGESFVGRTAVRKISFMILIVFGESSRNKTFVIRYRNSTLSSSSSTSLTPTPVLSPNSPFLFLLSSPCSLFRLYLPAFPSLNSDRI